MRLDKRDHASLALWATNCTEHVLPYFEEKCPKDDDHGEPSRHGGLGRVGR